MRKIVNINFHQLSFRLKHSSIEALLTETGLKMAMTV